jgi:hypothetical protein
MTAWRALAGPATFSQSRKPAKPGARSARIDGRSQVRPVRDKRSCSVSGKVWADGAWIIDMMHVLSKTYGKGVWEKAQKLNTLQPYAPSRRRCFYLAVHRWGLNSPSRSIFSALRNRASHVSGPASSARRLLTAASVNGGRTVVRRRKQHALPATLMTIGQHCVRRPSHDLLIWGMPVSRPTFSRHWTYDGRRCTSHFCHFRTHAVQYPVLQLNWLLRRNDHADASPQWTVTSHFHNL